MSGVEAGAYYDASFSCSAQCAAAVLPFSESCRYEYTSFCDAILKQMPSFYQDGLGANIGQALKKRETRVFLQRDVGYAHRCSRSAALGVQGDGGD